jgi:hypothetical protein
MTAMVLSHCARGVPVSAEILDAAMKPYLRMAQVGEVILTREYNSILLANATGEIGLSNIIFELLNPETPQSSMRSSSQTFTWARRSLNAKHCLSVNIPTW